jgi:hypothetical protein
MLVSYDDKFRQKVEAMASAMWNEDSVLATGDVPPMQWSEVESDVRDRWTRLAQIALLTEKAFDAYARPAA